MLLINVLGSSSAGNCYLVHAPLTNEILMLDAGVSFKEIQKAINYNFKTLIGVLITHEHGDHIRSAEKLANTGIDIYSTEGTFKAKNLIGHRYNVIHELKEFKVGNFKILPFKIQHDAAEPIGFLIEFIPTKERILYATDTFYIKYKFKQINYFLIECNYDKETLKKNIESKIIERTRYKRLLKSHMSLDNCIEFLNNNINYNTKKIVLIHLSDDNSDENKMISSIYSAFNISTIAAKPKDIIELKEYQF